MPILFAIKAGVSLQRTVSLPKKRDPYFIRKPVTRSFVSSPGTISSSFIYLGGLKKCVTQKFSTKSFSLPFTISLTGIPDVLEVINVPLFLFFSIKSNIFFLISIFSTTTSITQSDSSILLISSSKLPNCMFSLFSSTYNDPGFVFKVLKKDVLTNLFLTTLSFNVSPFSFSVSKSSEGHMSNNRTLTPMLAK